MTTHTAPRSTAVVDGERGWRPSESFGSRLTQIRRTLNLNTEQMGEILEVSASSISNWERNKTLPSNPMELALRLAEKTGVDPVWLLLGDDQNWKELTFIELFPSMSSSIGTAA